MGLSWRDIPGVATVERLADGDMKGALSGGSVANAAFKTISGGKDLPNPITEAAFRDVEKFEGESAALADQARQADALKAEFANDLQTHVTGWADTIQSPGAYTVAKTATPRLPNEVSQVGAQQLTAAQAGGPQVINAQSIQGPAAVTAQNVVAPSMNLAQGINSAQVLPAVRAQTQSAQNVTLGNAAQTNASTMTATRLDPAALAEAQRAEAARISMNPQEQMRANQTALVSSLQGAAAGTSGPSAAEAVLRRGMDEAIAAQAAIAGQARGSNVALAGRQAAINASSLTTKAAQEAAILKAQEQQAARKELGEALGTSRSQDIGVATSQAGLQNTTNLANLDASTRTALANAGAQNTQQLTQAGFIQDANKANLDSINQSNLANQAALNQRSLAQGNLTQGTNLANLDASTRTELANAAAQNAVASQQATLDQGANLFTAEQQNDQAKFLATQSLAAQQANQDANLRAGLANQGTDLAASTTNAQMAQDAATKNAANDLQTQLANAGFANDIGRANQSADLAAEQANAAAANARTEFQAKLGVDVSQFNATQQNAMNLQLQEIEARIATANATNNLDARRLAEQERQNLRSSILAAGGQSIDATTAVINAKSGAAAAQAEKDKGTMNAAGSALALLSDADRKEMIQSLPDNDQDVQQFMDVLNAYSYRYKDPDQEGAAPGERFGITVQDVEKSKIGKTLVLKTPGGKQINVPQATGALMAVVGHLNKRIKTLEAR